MTRMKTVFTLAAVLPLAVACAVPKYDLKSTEGLSAKGGAFNEALHKEYLDLAQREDNEADHWDAAFFDGKAIAAAKGGSVGPQKISERSLPQKAVPKFEAAEKRLLAALEKTASKKIPGKAARAQAMFDCWLQEKEENDQPEDIARCRAGFDEALGAVETALAKTPAPKKKVAAKKPAKPARPPAEYIIFFDLDKSDLTAEAKDEIDAIVKDYKKGRKSINLKGHADRAGGLNYNQKLSEKRARKVRTALIIAGIPPNKIKMNAVGETKPRIPTANGVPEAGNRRVSVLLK